MSSITLNGEDYSINREKVEKTRMITREEKEREMEKKHGQKNEREGEKMLEVHNYISYDEGPSAVLNG